MKKYRKLLIAIFLFILVIIGSKVGYQSLSNNHKYDVTDKISINQSEENSTEDKKIAPDFVVEDGNGEERTLQSFLGKPIVLNFWASWCMPCKAELPDFQAAYDKYGSEVEFVMVNLTDGMRETEEAAKEYFNTNGYSLPIYFDMNQEAAYTYSIYSIPTTFFISADGEVLTSIKGMIDSETLEDEIAIMLTK